MLRKTKRLCKIIYFNFNCDCRVASLCHAPIALPPLPTVLVIVTCANLKISVKINPKLHQRSCHATQIEFYLLSLRGRKFPKTHFLLSLRARQWSGRATQMCSHIKFYLLSILCRKLPKLHFWLSLTAHQWSGRAMHDETSVSQLLVIRLERLRALHTHLTLNFNILDA